MDIVSVALKRYSTKAFDATKKLTAGEAEQLKTLLQYSPSSTNSQPWHFIVASTDEGKARVAKAASGTYVFNERKILDASHDQWMAKQVYLNVGNFLLGVAAMGLDAVPIEGVDFAILDEEFDLKAQGYTSLVVVPVGHHSVEDFNATLPKSRLPQSTTITEI